MVNNDGDANEPSPESKTGGLDGEWIDTMLVRLSKEWQRELYALERAQKARPDPIGPLCETLDVLERMLKVQSLMRKARPKRSRLARRRRKLPG